MSICHPRLTDAKSVWIRFFIGIICTFPVGIFACFVYRFNIAYRVMLLGALVYVNLMWLGFDLWKLRNPDVAEAAETRLRILAFLPLLIGLPLPAYLLR